MPRLTSNLYEFGEFRLDPQQRVLRRGEEPIALTPKVFEVLVLLIRHSGEVVSKDELMKAVWPNSFVEESNLTQTVFMLRKALSETADQRYILTIQGRGYRFAADVKDLSESGRAGTDPSASLSADSSLRSGQVLVSPLRTEAPGARQPVKKARLLLGAAAVVVVAIGVAAYLRWSASPSPSREPRGRLMLAVLPFQNLTGDPTQEYFSDGLTEEMIAQLGHLDPQRLGVIARTSVMHYKNGQTSIEQISRELGVQYVIEGSVRRDSNNVRVSAQLIRTRDQTHVWARQYDRELKGLLSLQGEIAQEIADEIQLTLGDRKAIAAPTLSSSQYEAYDLYLKGQYFLDKRTVPGFEAAIDYFQQAVAKNPNDARAYAGLADSYALKAAYSSRPKSEFMSKARAAALKALEIDDSLPEAHTALALIVQNNDWDWQTAEKEFRRAMELNPNYATAHHWYAEHLMWRGRFDEALQESERARQLDPLSLIIAADNGAILYYSRQYDRAIDKWRSVLEMDPYFPRAALIHDAFVEKGMFAEARAYLEKDRQKMAAPWYWSTLAYAYGRSGQTAKARYAIHELLQGNQHEPVDARIIAWAYAGLGDKDQELAWLEKAYAQHSNELTALKVDPGYDSLRSDPRFQTLLRRVGLAN
jgi:TolB-like protein/DNA-binding winged helix-turn-helix (wHTH) protein/Flp pilus assembly protein TadD